MSDSENTAKETRKGRPKKIETLSAGGDGNTKPPASDPKISKKQPNQLVFWCFTLNNFDKYNNIIETLDLYFKANCKWYVFQHERGGDMETDHLQGVICLKVAARWTEFNLPKAIHWEKCEKIEASIKYCSKLTYIGGRVSDERIWHSPDIVVPHEELIHWVGWNSYLRDCIVNDVERRKILWFWSASGRMGKTAFTRWCVDKFGAQFCSGGKYTDICNLVFHTDMDKCPVMIFTLPRNHRNHISYSALESIKDGLVSNMKSYANASKKFNRIPHVIIFANYPPDMDPDKMSSDRWIVHQIDFMSGVKNKK